MAIEQPSDVWVEVEVVKGNLVSVYRGRMAFAVLDAWKKGEITKGVMELNDTYWSYDDGDGNEGWVVVGATPGPYASAVGTTYMRADQVLVIVPLRDGNERETHKLRPIGGANRDDDY
jgi:hypothetical protein